ncbi:hypothetical protein, partial [Microbacterium tumbae]
ILDLDPGLAGVVDSVREVHAPIWQAIEDGRPVAVIDFAMLSGVVQALLNAIDSRLPQPPAAMALMAVAA